MCLHGAYRHIRERERLRGAAPDDSSLSVKDPSVRPSARPVFCLAGWSLYCDALKEPEKTKD